MLKGDAYACGAELPKSVAYAGVDMWHTLRGSSAQVTR